MQFTIGRATEDDWQRAFDACPWATFFQSPAWYRHAASLLPRHELMLWSAEVDGTTVILPFLERPAPAQGGAADRRGNAAGVYGGWVASDPLTPSAAAALLVRLGQGTSALRLRFNPFHPLPARAALPGFAWEEDHTSVIDLRRPLADIWSAYASGQRRNLRAAQRSSARCRRATASQDWQDYLALYAKTLQRWGDRASSRYSDSFLLGFQGLPGASLWLAERDGRLGATILAFEKSGHIVLWHSANDADQADWFPFKLLIHEILTDAHARGLHTFDLNPSGSAAGSSQWKLLLGAQRLPAPVLVAAKPPGAGTTGPPPARD